MKLLVVVGATGTQGRNVICHFLAKEPEYTIRGLTRNVKSSRALGLSNRGVQMVQADLGDLSSLKAAFAGANAIFAYTDSAGVGWSYETLQLFESGRAKSIPQAAGQVEEQQGRNIADAAATIPTLERLVFSNTVNPTKLSNGKYKIYELEAKANILAYMRGLPQLDGKVSGVVYSMFVEGLLRNAELYGWKKTGNEKYSLRVPFSQPDSRAPWIDMERDAGSYVSSLLRAPAGVNVVALTDYLSFVDLVKPLEEKYGIKIDVGTISEDEFAARDDTGLMRQIYQLHALVDEIGIGENSSDFLKPSDLRDRGYEVSQSSLLDAVKKMDWQHLL